MERRGGANNGHVGRALIDEDNGDEDENGGARVVGEYARSFWSF